jgi:cytochrome c oxidase subunit 2
MTEPRRLGPSPALVLLVSSAAAVLVFLLILALRGGDIIDQLRQVWASFFPPDPTTSQGRVIDDLYTFVFIIAAAIFLFVEGLIVYAVVRYRRKPGDTELPPQIHGNNVLEIAWTIVPTIIVAAMFVLSWQALNTVDAATADPTDTRIRVVASRFQFTFDYLSGWSSRRGRRST